MLSPKSRPGEKHPRATIPEAVAQGILNEPLAVPRKAVAAKWGVPPNMVTLIRNRHRWKHLKPNRRI